MIANVITASRIAAALALLACAPSSTGFWVLYGWCGVSDMIDGPLARRFGGENAVGARLDSAADLVFVIACAVKLLPVLHFDAWLVVWVAAIAACKVFNLISNITKNGAASYLHSIANKAAGLAVFATIPALFFSAQPVVALPACAIATLAAIQECRLIRSEGKPSLHSASR